MKSKHHGVRTACFRFGLCQGRVLAAGHIQLAQITPKLPKVKAEASCPHSMPGTSDLKAEN